MKDDALRQLSCLLSSSPRCSPRRSHPPCRQTALRRLIGSGNWAERLPHRVERVRYPMNPFGNPLTGLPKPLTGLPNPLTDLPNPLTGLPNRLTGLPNRLTGLPNRLTGLLNRLTGLLNRLTGLLNRLTGLLNPSSPLRAIFWLFVKKTGVFCIFTRRIRCRDGQRLDFPPIQRNGRRRYVMPAGSFLAPFVSFVVQSQNPCPPNPGLAFRPPFLPYTPRPQAGLRD